MKRRLIRFVVYLFIAMLMASSGFALFSRLWGSTFDPVAEIKKLQAENRRDDALDLAEFICENNPSPKIQQLRDDLQYHPAEKFKSLVWNGIFKGEIFDTYSGIGCLASDLCIAGDIRDTAIQSFKLMTDDPGFDKLVLILSGAGIALTGTPLDLGNAFVKTSVKYLRRFPRCLDGKLVKDLIAGKIPASQLQKMTLVLKKTTIVCPKPYPAFLMSVT